MKSLATYTKTEFMFLTTIADTYDQFEALAFVFNDEREYFCRKDLDQMKWLFDKQLNEFYNKEKSFE